MWIGCVNYTIPGTFGFVHKPTISQSNFLVDLKVQSKKPDPDGPALV